MTAKNYPGPGPQERKLRNRLIFKMTGRWPQTVVSERLSTYEAMVVAQRQETIARMKEIWTAAE